MQEMLLISNRIVKRLDASIKSSSGGHFYGHAFGAIHYLDDTLYQYGGFNASGGTDGGFRWRRDSDVTPTYWTNAIYPGVVLEFPSMADRNGVIYCIGRHSDGRLCVLAFTIATNTFKTYFHTAINYSSGASAYLDKSTGILHYHQFGSDKIYFFDTNTNTFGSSISMTYNGSPVTYTEHIYVNNGYLYTAGGWTGSNHNTRQFRVNLATGVSELWFTHAANQGTVNQGCALHNGVFYYATWDGTLRLNAYDPIRRRISDYPGNPLPSRYRNCTVMTRAKTGFYWGGGTSIPVGNTNWKSNGKTTELFFLDMGFPYQK